MTQPLLPGTSAAQLPHVVRVVVDTDVLSTALIPNSRTAQRLSQPVNALTDRDREIIGWQAALTGTQVVLAAQTRAEVLFGIRAAGWGLAQANRFAGRLDRFTTYYPDLAVVDAWAALRAACKAAGHALADKHHMGDAWVAATAIALSVPLLAGDNIYTGAPGLVLL